MEHVQKRRRPRKTRAAGTLKNALLLCLCLVTLAVPILSGTGGTAFAEPVTAQAAAYDDLALDLAGATAFDDAQKLAAKDGSDTYATFKANLGTLCDPYWGNVGIFIGPKGTSENSDVWSVFYSKVSVSQKQIDEFDGNTGKAFSKYKAFGEAVQKANERAKKGGGSSYSLQKGLDSVTSAGAKLANLGVSLVEKFNPAPLVLAMVDVSELDSHPDNELVQLVNGNRNIREVFNVLGGPIAFGLPTSFVIMAFIVIFLIISGAILVLFNGRSAGENVRKAMSRILIACIGVPLIASVLNSGISFLGDVTTPATTATEDNYVRQNLNLMDWYATGFAIPSGTSVVINEDGEFAMTQSAIEAINKYTYKAVTGGNPTSAAMMERMEALYNLSEAYQASVAFQEPMKDGGVPWKTENYYKILDNFGSNKETLNEGVDFGETGDAAVNALANVGYLVQNNLSMSEDDGVWTVGGNCSDTDMGISPIAATNLMRTTFTGSAMTANENGTIGGVIFNADINSTSADDYNNMNPLVRFLAMWAIIMAGIRGLVTIFTAGFGGIIGGSAKSAMGLSTGLGQALGGVVALVGGIFGISLIMTLSFTLLDQVYGVLAEVLDALLSTFGTGPDDLIKDIGSLTFGLKLFGALLEKIFTKLASVIMTFIAGFTLPKFGGVPVTLFCQYMAEIPHRFAQRAELMESRFTGDYMSARGGGGYGGAMSSASTLMNNAYNQAGNQLKQMGAGAATIAGAVGGFGLTKLGQKLEKSGTHSSDKSMASSSSDKETNAENTDPNSMDPNVNPDANPDAATPENTSPEGNPEGAENEGMDPQATDAAEGGKDGDNNLSVNQDGNPEGAENEGKDLQATDAAEGGKDGDNNLSVSQDGDTTQGDEIEGKDPQATDAAEGGKDGDNNLSVNQDGDTTQGDAIEGKEISQEATSSEDSMARVQSDQASESNTENQHDADSRSDSQVDATDSMVSDQDSRDTVNAEDDQLHETQTQAENLAEQQSMSDLRSEQNGQTVNENNTQTMNQSDQRSSQEHSAEARAAHEQKIANQMRSDVRSSEKASSMAHTGSEHSAQSIHNGEHSQTNQSDSSVHSHASARSNSSHIAEKAVGGAAIAGALHQASQKANGKTGSVAGPSTQRDGRNGKTGTMNPQRAKAPGTGTGTRTGSVNAQRNPNTVRQGQPMTAAAGGGNLTKGPGKDPVVTRQGQPITTGSKNLPKGPAAAPSQGTPNKGDAVRSQRVDRFKVAAGKALQAAGGHTDASAMVGGIAAGAVHTVGSMMGAENVTQRAIVANREALARRRDIAQGRNPADRRRRENNQQPKNSQQPNAGHTANDRRTVSQARYDERVAQEEAIRQTEREEAARRNPRE